MKTAAPWALSIDVEEYFQVANLRGVFPESGWERIESRLDAGMDALLGALERRGSHATFFFLGWVAERRPDLVRRCVDGGHEIGSHGFAHAFLWDIGPQGLERELERTEQALWAAASVRPLGFRASNFTLTRRTFWAFELLARRGYVYDSSIHPVRHPTYGMPDFEPGISRVPTRHGPELIEFPVATLRCLGRNLPVGGGGYFRLLPLGMTRRALRAIEATGRPVALYFHPWEFDPDQPRVAVSAFKRFRHYVNLQRTLPRLERLLAERPSSSMRSLLEQRGYWPSTGTAAPAASDASSSSAAT
jgi:polysaccharide deacetylase family protein (PEP-CTERM system associated)